MLSFAKGASPYITLAQARHTSGDNLHLGCDIVPNSIKTNFRDHSIELKVTDKNGEAVTVIHRGDPVNLKEAKRIVAVGKLDGGVFRSHQILVKCPSKYEGEEAKSTNERSK